MKRTMKYFGHFLCTLALIVCFAQPVSAADETNYFDCTVFLYGFDAAVENITASSSAIQIQAGDGSGDTWVVASYGVTSGSTYYLATDPYDSSVGSVAELIMGDAESGVAVFRLDRPLTSRTAPALRTLDGLNEGEGAVVAGVADDSDGMFLFSRGVLLQGLADQSGYTRLQLEDGAYPLSELDILPIGAVMSDVDEVIGFYLEGYQALPAGYIMSDAGGIGSLGSGESEPSSPDPTDPEPGSGGEEPAYTLESIQTNTGTQTLLEQARAQQGQTRILQIVLIAAAGIAAAGIIAFAIVRSRKKASSQASTSQTTDTGGNPAPDFGKTEYVGGEQYGKPSRSRPSTGSFPSQGRRVIHGKFPSRDSPSAGSRSATWSSPRIPLASAESTVPCGGAAVPCFSLIWTPPSAPCWRMGGNCPTRARISSPVCVST